MSKGGSWRIRMTSNSVSSTVLGFAQGEMIAALAPDRHATCNRLHLAFVKAQMTRQVMPDFVAAALGFERHHEAGILVDVDRLDRIHLQRDGQASFS